LHGGTSPTDFIISAAGTSAYQGTRRADFESTSSADWKRLGDQHHVFGDTSDSFPIER
jgi:hypothetical protein